MNPQLLYCIGIGYLFGCFLTASLIGRIHHIDIFEKGSGNPGMTNTIKVLGKTAGILVLAGDILKTLLAILLCEFLFPELGSLCALYTGFGVCLGHCFPFWHHFQGGKGVACVAVSYVLFNPVAGIAALLAGDAIQLFFKKIKLAAAAISAIFCAWILFSDPRAIVLIPALAMGILMAWLNLRPNRLIDGQKPELALQTTAAASHPNSEKKEDVYDTRSKTR